MVHTGDELAWQAADTPGPLNVDTDRIIPARFMTRPTARGCEDVLFHDWRKDEDFVLYRPGHRGVSILIAGEDFGTGSSREAAVWALQDYGFRAVIAPRFGDIFRVNALQRGLPAVVLPTATVEVLWGRVERAPDTPVTIDVHERVVRVSDQTYAFELDDYSRWRLLNGLDDTALALTRADAIEAYERNRRPALPRTNRVNTS
ncbi:3-isopropylmalate dehydratase small subunit [Streptomyces purpurascens]|uniref:3-isopropylmalate dehydratase small subunit n=1 Tax=Streptomyces purpurascens TaxID=1924 RepID=UPI001E3711C8|nr:3-isopropylmalate dehydratase small subunit [Streptomyces purpurascens]MCE7050195.1 3-isopropylmalate dehydratase small subunit [Streptomyces purpurascens]